MFVVAPAEGKLHYKEVFFYEKKAFGLGSAAGSLHDN